MKKSVLWLALFITLAGSTPSRGQISQDSIVDQIYAVLILDSLTVTANQNQPDVKYMISQTIHDTTFYRAFQRLRRESYRFSSELYFYKPGWTPLTYMKSIRDQRIVDGRRTNEIVEEFIHRDMKDRKGGYEFYTARMYDRIFFTHHPTPVPVRWSDDVTEMGKPDSRMQQYVQDLKLLLFAPGTKIDIPLMGDKTAIFTDDQMKNYQYSISLDTSAYESPVYEFMIRPDSGIARDQTVIKELLTVFDAETMQVLHRTYRLAYKTLAYSFDITMNIRVESNKGVFLPTTIAYDGWWKIPFKKPEWCRFTFRILQYY